jgi:Putative peptidoglycan binding domain
MRTEGSELRAAANALAELRNLMLAIAVGTLVLVICLAAANAAETAAAQDVEVTPMLVREIQFMLTRLGTNPGPIDGIVGPQTTKALLKFQEQSGLPPVELVSGASISASLLARLREDASRAIFAADKEPEASPAVATPPAAPIQPAPRPADRFAECTFRPEDFRIGNIQYTPDKYLREGFDGSTARAVAMLKDRLNEARQLAGNIGGAALPEVQRQSRVLDYFRCRFKIEQASEAKK